MQLNQEVRSIIEGAFGLHAQGRLEEAVQVYDKLLARIDYDDANLLYGYGTLLAEQGYPGIALQLLQRAVAVAPKACPAWSNLGVAYRNVERLKDAEAAHAKAVELEPNNPLTLTNMAGAFVNRSMPDKVVEWGRKAIAADPEYADGHVHLALGLLEQGKFDEAWPHYEYRWKMAARKKDIRPYKAPQWKGEYVTTLAIHGEQGLGDEIMFMACYREAAKRVGRVIIECAPRLVDLFNRSFPEATIYENHSDLITAEGEPDAYIPMGSLPFVVGLPLDGKPYLARSQVAGAPKSRPLIGLSWRGGTDKTNSTLRSIPLSKWAPILCVDADFISLQYGPDDVDLEAQQCDVETLPNRDFGTIADALSRCDLVITACQTNVHLAGAMGIPCFVLTPERSAWRYCRDRMEWYDSVHLFKKRAGASWDDVISRVAIASQTRLKDAA